MHADDQVMAVEEAFWDLISGGLQNFHPVKGCYGSGIVVTNVKDLSKGESMTYGPISFSKNF